MEDADSAPGVAHVATVTSASLLEGLKHADNQTVWRDYVDRYRPLIVSFARRIGFGEADAEDVAQASLLAFSSAYLEGAWIDERVRAIESACQPRLLAVALGVTVLMLAMLLGVLCASESAIYYGRP